MMKNMELHSVRLALAPLAIFMLGTSYAQTETAPATPQSVTFDPIFLDHNSADVPDMAIDGSDGTITRTWRRTGKNRGYYIYIVTDVASSSLVQIEGDDTMTTDPQHAGKNSLSAILFARRDEHDGTHATLYLLKATRHPQKGESIASPLPTTVELYALTHCPPEFLVNSTSNYFQSDTRADIGNFTSAEAALDAVVKKHLDHQTLMLLGTP